MRPCRGKKIVSGHAEAEEPAARIVVMVSGNGSNLQALVDAIENDALRASITLVVSSNSKAFAIHRAELAGLPTLVMPYRRDIGLDPALSRKAYDRLLAEKIAPYSPDYIFLLGWMRILTDEFIARFRGKIVNLHPALPGDFPGTHAIERAWEAFGRGEISRTGVMMHFVPDEAVDAGPVIVLETVEMSEHDTFDSFEHRMHATEHALVAKVAGMLIESRKKGGV